MSNDSVTLPVLDAYLAACPKHVPFPPAIEAVFEEQRSTYRLEVMKKSILRAVVIYNLFLPIDILLLPGTTFVALALHLTLITPAIFAIGWLYRKFTGQLLRDATAAIIPFMMLSQIMFIYSLNQGEAADDYQYLGIMIVIYSNVNQRLTFRVALNATLVLVTTYLAFLLLGHSPFATKVIGSALVLSAAYLTLMANWRMEQDVRQLFLLHLRDQLRREGAEVVAKRDALTGLSNRRQLDETVSAIWAEADTASQIAVVMIDIDHFKSFNDRYGHVVGDTCLKRVAAAIATELRNGDDLLVRYGGEEFLILMPDADLTGAMKIAERIRRRVESLSIPQEDLGSRGVVTVSLGAIAECVATHAFAELVAAADAALYAAKRNGRNQVWPPFMTQNNSVALLKRAMPAA